MIRYSSTLQHGHPMDVKKVPPEAYVNDDQNENGVESVLGNSYPDYVEFISYFLIGNAELYREISGSIIYRLRQISQCVYVRHNQCSST